MEYSSKEATPIEIAAMLMDAACTSVQAEQEAVAALAAHLRVDLAQMQLELMFLRAFAVDFATSMTLGAGPEREAVLDCYYRHWDRIDQEVGGVMEDLQVRLQTYMDAINSPEVEPTGLQEIAGRTFARCCQKEVEEQDLALFGGAMFGALYAEIATLLQEVDIALQPPEEAGSAPFAVE
jgi:hypothetical protein